MISPLIKQLATRTLAGVPARDVVAAFVANVEADFPFATLLVGFSSLESAVDAPAGAGASVAALLAVLIASATGGDVGAELLRVSLPLALSLALARVSSTLDDAEPPSDDGDGGYSAQPADPVASSWEARLKGRARQREAENAVLIDALVRSTRGISAQKGEALKRCCAGRDARKLSPDDWARCEGIGQTLAQRVHDELRQLDQVDARR